MTLKEALKACVDLWAELAKTGNQRKPAGADQYLFGCPMCSYVKESYGEVGYDQADVAVCADVCPMKEVWGNSNGCLGEGSPYRAWAWDHLDREHLKLKAAEIRDGAQRLLDAL